MDDRTIARRPRPPRGSEIHNASSLRRWLLLGIAAVATGTALTLWWMSRAQPTPAMPTPTAATDVPLGVSRPRAKAIELPGLDESDTLFRDLVSALSKHPLLASVLVPKGLIRATVLAVIQVGDGVTPVAALAPAKPSSRLQIQGDRSGHIEPATYRRWDAAVAALTSVNPTELAQTYVNLKPLFDQAYRELGHPEGNFDAALVRAFQTLDATPQITTDPILLRRTGYFEHDDPSLRALLPVQKQLLLLGPGHRQRVMRWLRDVASSLDLKID
jgi:hypothetical protein